jgi:hypothetical protein
MHGFFMKHDAYKKALTMNNKKVEVGMSEKSISENIEKKWATDRIKNFDKKIDNKKYKEENENDERFNEIFSNPEFFIKNEKKNKSKQDNLESLKEEGEEEDEEKKIKEKFSTKSYNDFEAENINTYTKKTNEKSNSKTQSFKERLKENTFKNDGKLGYGNREFSYDSKEKRNNDKFNQNKSKNKQEKKKLEKKKPFKNDNKIEKRERRSFTKGVKKNNKKK